ncbi:hypothetical protein NADFUDRAFT_67562 [Nadsonia fulvescens var. elongata DSM 6958]|uniref:TEA domain-containing protein n=1 Tax=Nadsonia fulvescens var. elongata DSM 6958 TaxID=857566 RepID=A0A1E3PDQ7_9ASCO|nr:hypothetical protein NADFUDRAFT_67562 [Nadsonia fulvescens var. elongata DSM 6958]
MINEPVTPENCFNSEKVTNHQQQVLLNVYHELNPSDLTCTDHSTNDMSHSAQNIKYHHNTGSNNGHFVHHDTLNTHYTLLPSALELTPPDSQIRKSTLGAIHDTIHTNSNKMDTDDLDGKENIPLPHQSKTTKENKLATAEIKTSTTAKINVETTISCNENIYDNNNDTDNKRPPLQDIEPGNTCPNQGSQVVTPRRVQEGKLSESERKRARLQRIDINEKPANGPTKENLFEPQIKQLQSQRRQSQGHNQAKFLDNITEKITEKVEKPPRIIKDEEEREDSMLSSIQSRSAALKKATSCAESHAAYEAYLKRQKRDGDDLADVVWCSDVEDAFMEAIRMIPLVGRRKVCVNDKPCGRNELIAQYIFKKTGKMRTRKQVSSHIQVLKNLLKEDEEFLKLIVDEFLKTTSGIKTESQKEKNKVAQTYLLSGSSFNSADADMKQPVILNSAAVAVTSVSVNSNILQDHSANNMVLTGSPQRSLLTHNPMSSSFLPKQISKNIHLASPGMVRFNSYNGRDSAKLYTSPRLTRNVNSVISQDSIDHNNTHDNIHNTHQPGLINTSNLGMVHFLEPDFINHPHNIQNPNNNSHSVSNSMKSGDPDVQMNYIFSPLNFSMQSGDDTSLSDDSNNPLYHIYSQLGPSQFETPIKSKRLSHISERFPDICQLIVDSGVVCPIIHGRVGINIPQSKSTGFCDSANENRGNVENVTPTKSDDSEKNSGNASKLRTQLQFLAASPQHQNDINGSDYDDSETGIKSRTTRSTKNSKSFKSSSRKSPMLHHQWRCETKIFTMGQEVLSIKNNIPSVETKPGDVDTTDIPLLTATERLQLPFAVDFWAAFLNGIESINEDDDFGANIDKSNLQSKEITEKLKQKIKAQKVAIEAITITQKVFCRIKKSPSTAGGSENSKDQPRFRLQLKDGEVINTLYSVILWEFYMSEENTPGRTVFRKIDCNHIHSASYLTPSGGLGLSISARMSGSRLPHPNSQALGLGSASDDRHHGDQVNSEETIPMSSTPGCNTTSTRSQYNQQQHLQRQHQQFLYLGNSPIATMVSANSNTHLGNEPYMSSRMPHPSSIMNENSMPLGLEESTLPDVGSPLEGRKLAQLQLQQQQLQLNLQLQIQQQQQALQQHYLQQALQQQQDQQHAQQQPTAAQVQLQLQYQAQLLQLQQQYLLHPSYQPVLFNNISGIGANNNSNAPHTSENSHSYGHTNHSHSNMMTKSFSAVELPTKYRSSLAPPFDIPVSHASFHVNAQASGDPGVGAIYISPGGGWPMMDCTASLAEDSATVEAATATTPITEADTTATTALSAVSASPSEALASATTPRSESISASTYVPVSTSMASSNPTNEATPTNHYQVPGLFRPITALGDISGSLPSGVNANWFLATQGTPNGNNNGNGPGNHGLANFFGTSQLAPDSNCYNFNTMGASSLGVPNTQSHQGMINIGQYQSTLGEGSRSVPAVMDKNNRVSFFNERVEEESSAKFINVGNNMEHVFNPLQHVSTAGFLKSHQGHTTNDINCFNFLSRSPMFLGPGSASSNFAIHNDLNASPALNFKIDDNGRAYTKF